MASITSYPRDQYGRERKRVRIKRNGRNVISKVITGSRLDAQEWAVEQERLINGGRQSAAAAAAEMTLDRALDRYLQTESRKKKSCKDDHSRARLLKARNPSLVASPLDQINPYDLELMRQDIMEVRDCSGATFNRYLHLIGAVYKTARTKWRMVTLASPTYGMSEPETPRERRPMDAELEALWPALEGLGKQRSVPLLEIVQLALYTGMRQAELVGLRAEEVDLRHGYITVPASRSKTARTARYQFFPPPIRYCARCHHGLPAGCLMSSAMVITCRICFRGQENPLAWRKDWKSRSVCVFMIFDVNLLAGWLNRDLRPQKLWPLLAIRVLKRSASTRA